MLKIATKSSCYCKITIQRYICGKKKVRNVLSKPHADLADKKRKTVMNINFAESFVLIHAGTPVGTGASEGKNCR